MFPKALLAALFVATVAAAPPAPRAPQYGADALTGMLPFPTGLGGGGLGGAMPPGGPDGLGSLGGLSLPTGLLGGHGSGSGSGGGSLPIPTSPAGGSGSGMGSLGSPVPGLGPSSSPGLSGPGGPGSSSTPPDGAQGGCKAVTLIFARGTSEPGTMGTVVGPGLASDTEAALGADNVAVQGVAYPASPEGNAGEAVGGGGGDGAAAMAADVERALAGCPGTAVVLAGYSQGAMVVHNALGRLAGGGAGAGQGAAAGVRAAVTFGDPLVSRAPAGLAAGAFRSFCADGDGLCAAGAGPSSPSSGGTGSQSALGHLGYGADTAAAAAFIRSRVAG